MRSWWPHQMSSRSTTICIAIMCLWMQATDFMTVYQEGQSCLPAWSPFVLELCEVMRKLRKPFVEDLEAVAQVLSKQSTAQHRTAPMQPAKHISRFSSSRIRAAWPTGIMSAASCLRMKSHDMQGWLCEGGGPLAAAWHRQQGCSSSSG